jgi:hypothetical protein
MTTEHFVEPPPYVIPAGWSMLGLGRCRSCAAPVMWCMTHRGKRAPIDRDGTNHFATCPNAAAWRHRR